MGGNEKHAGQNIKGELYVLLTCYYNTYVLMCMYSWVAYRTTEVIHSFPSETSRIFIWKVNKK